jgi:hypothetical protein
MLENLMYKFLGDEKGRKGNVHIIGIASGVSITYLIFKYDSYYDLS